MATMFWWCVTILAVMGGVGIMALIWRVNLAINHPEKYQRLVDAEKEHAQRHEEATKKAIETAKPVVAAGAKVAGAILSRVFKR